MAVTMPQLFLYAQTLNDKIDRLVYTELDDTTGPGAVFLVAHNGKVIYEKGFGKANIESGVAMNPQNVFQLGSITKQFTAVAIMILQEQGKLSVKDPVSKYIADYPGGDKITIHQLLTHTSGIKDFTKMKSLGEIAQKNMTPKMMIDFFKNEPVDFIPGEKFEYNNSGYVLLGYLIELVSGETYENFIQKHLFEKAGMWDSRYATDRLIVLKRAYGYHKKEYGYVNKTQINFSVPFASGALMSTAADMLKWQNALNNHILINPKSNESIFSQYKLNNGDTFTYGYGWHLREMEGQPVREHGGSIFGFKTMGVYLPKKDIYVIGLSNCDCFSPTQLARDIALLTAESVQ
jgi:CubicO group peptidase (beta-lactamase class C family)